MSEMQNRHPAGVPTGGQYAASARAESDVDLVDTTEPSTDPVPLADVLATEHVLTVTPDQFGSTDLDVDRIDVMSDGADGFVVYPTIETDLRDDLGAYLCRERGWDPSGDRFPEAHAAAHAWLVENGDVLNDRLASHYGATNDPAHDWDDTQRLYCESELDADATTADVIEAAEITHATHLREDIDSGSLFSDSFLDRQVRDPRFTGGHVGDDRIRQMTANEVDCAFALAQTETPTEEPR